MIAFAAVWAVLLGPVRADVAARPGPPPGAPRLVNVLLVSGIWPPDVGGPASHAPALAAHLHEHGHQVEVPDDRGIRPGGAAVPGALG